MSENTIKICYNIETGITSFQFLNDNGNWSVMDKSSALSRRKLTTAISEGRIKELLETINSIYNIDDCGVKILFTGDPQILKKIVNEARNYQSMKCEYTEVRCAVLGKRNSGKTFLCEALFELVGKTPKIVNKKEYTIYSNSEEGLCIFEINGIDVGEDKVNQAQSYLRKSIDNKVKKVLYCLSGKTGKIEDIECTLIKEIESEGVQVIPVITCCIDEKRGREFANQICQALGEREVIFILAKDLKTKVGVIPSFGMEDVYKGITGGNR